MYSKKQIHQLMTGNRNRISQALYPKGEIWEIITEIARDEKEFQAYLKYAKEWVSESFI